MVRNRFLSPLQGSASISGLTPGLRPGLLSFRPSRAGLKDVGNLATDTSYSPIRRLKNQDKILILQPLLVQSGQLSYWRVRRRACSFKAAARRRTPRPSAETETSTSKRKPCLRSTPKTSATPIESGAAFKDRGHFGRHWQIIAPAVRRRAIVGWFLSSEASMPARWPHRA